MIELDSQDGGAFVSDVEDESYKIIALENMQRRWSCREVGIFRTQYLI